jgi:hypothetical protein
MILRSSFERNNDRMNPKKVEFPKCGCSSSGKRNIGFFINGTKCFLRNKIVKRNIGKFFKVFTKSKIFFSENYRKIDIDEIVENGFEIFKNDG